jgi:hypothetical protein
MAARKREATSELSLVVPVLTARHVMVFSHLFMSGIQDFLRPGAFDCQFDSCRAVVSVQEDR